MTRGFTPEEERAIGERAGLVEGEATGFSFNAWLDSPEAGRPCEAIAEFFDRRAARWRANGVTAQASECEVLAGMLRQRIVQ